MSNIDYIAELVKHVDAYKSAVVSERYADSAQARSWDIRDQQNALKRAQLVLDEITEAFGADGRSKALEYIEQHSPSITQRIK